MKTPQLDRAHLLVTRTDAIGDMLLTAPLFAALKLHFPQSRLSVLASRNNADIARLLPQVDEVIVEEGQVTRSSLIDAARWLRQLRVDVILFAYAKHRLAIVAWLARIPIRIGSARRAYAFLYSTRVPHDPVQHESDGLLRLLEPLGVRATPGKSVPLPLDPSDREKIAALLVAEGITAGARIAAVHAGNNGNALTAAPEWYAQLGDALVEAGYVVLLTGSTAELKLTGRIAAAMRHPAVDLAGRLSLRELAVLHTHCAVCIGSSTGPTHLAAAVGARVVGLYAPLAGQQRWLPLGPAVTVVRPAVGMTCPECLGERCRYFNCLDRIPVRDVVAAAADLQGKVGGC